MYKPYILSILAALALPVAAAEYHVALSGSDHNPGSQTAPFATLEKARGAARGTPGSTVWVHGGSYRMDQPLVLTPEDSGLTIQAHQTIE